MEDLAKGRYFLVAANDDNVAGIEMAGFRRLPRIHSMAANELGADMSDSYCASVATRCSIDCFEEMWRRRSSRKMSDSAHCMSVLKF